MSKRPSLPSDRVSWLDAAFRPLQDFYLWCREVDRQILAGAGGLADLQAVIAALEIKDTWAQTHVAVANGTYFVIRAPTAGTIDSTYTDCTSGTCSARWQINGVNVGSSANSVSTTADTETHTTNNEFEAGDIITVVLSSNSSCLGALLDCQVTRAMV